MEVSLISRNQPAYCMFIRTYIHTYIHFSIIFSTCWPSLRTQRRFFPNGVSISRNLHKHRDCREPRVVMARCNASRFIAFMILTMYLSLCCLPMGGNFPGDWGENGPRHQKQMIGYFCCLNLCFSGFPGHFRDGIVF